MPLTETIGAATIDSLAYVGGLARLVGGALRAVFIFPFQGKKFHVGRSIHQAMSVGVEALPITSLISFFVGTILAVNAAYELRKFGALHFVASGVAIVITRELGPLMTAIVVIGRSGSAFAAEIGTMKVNEEIDAMETMALEPVQFLVAPKFLAMLLMVAVYWLFRDFNPKRMDKYFRRLQLVSSAALSLSHGTNDAQKTMGIITAVLVSSKHLRTFEVPYWVLMSSYTVIALGTLSGGWRIIHTMGARLTKLKPRSGFCAETAAAISIIFAAHFMHPAPPVSTTHVTAGAIAGVGSIQRFKAVRWGIATNIVWAWILTIPASALVGWISLTIFHLFIPGL